MPPGPSLAKPAVGELGSLPGWRITGCRDDNRDTSLLRCDSSAGGADHQDVQLVPNQLIHERRQSCQIAVGVAVLDLIVPAFDEAQFLQALWQSASPSFADCLRVTDEHSDQGSLG